MSLFDWRPLEILERVDDLFEPVIESYSTNNHFGGEHKYFTLVREGDGGYLAKAEYYPAMKNRSRFYELKLSAMEFQTLCVELKSISIGLGNSIGGVGGSRGLIRVYQGGSGWIEVRYRSVTQPECEPLVSFINRATQRIDAGSDSPV